MAEYTLEMAADDIGRLVDEMDNVRAAGNLTVSTALKLALCHTYIEQWAAMLKKIYTDITNENPWSDNG